MQYNFLTGKMENLDSNGKIIIGKNDPLVNELNKNDAITKNGTIHYDFSKNSTTSKMTEFLSQVPFIIFFLLLTLIIGMFTNAKILYWFLLLVLFSMLVLNSGKFSSMFSKISF